MTKLLAVVVALALSLVPAPAESRQTTPNAPLKIVVISGEGAVNIIQHKSATAPVVEVRDRTDAPVAGASVTFAISGKSAAFASGAKSSIVKTDAAGRAVAATITPLSKGAVQIQVSASFSGQTAAATVRQTNVMTPADAASAKSSGGGGVSKTTIGTVAIAAGAAVFAVKSFTYTPPGETPAMTWIVGTVANGASITPCKSPVVSCELKLSDNEGVVQIRVEMTGVTADENKLVFDCGGCQMISGAGSQETFSFAPPPAHQSYTPGIEFPNVGAFPLRVTWSSGAATLASFTIVFTVAP